MLTSQSTVDSPQSTAGRLALLAALGVLLASSPALAKTRVAIPVFEIAGEGASPALGLQLQDGFVLGLVRAGLHVIDPLDVAKRLEGSPELNGCDSSPCLKAIGQKLDVQYVVRVKIETTGNSYKMVARTFSTQGAVPAALPLDTQSKSCDVCTITEARDAMLRLADAIKHNLEEPPTPAPPQPAPAGPPPSRSALVPLLMAMVGAVAVAGGVAMVTAAGECTQTVPGDCPEHRTRSVIGGALMGAGAATAGVSLYFTVARLRSASPAPAVALSFRF